jgi:hypothetical protein
MRGWPIISAIERAEEEKGFAQYERQNHIRAHRTNPGEIQNVRPLSAEEIIGKPGIQSDILSEAIGTVMVAPVVPGNQQEDFLVDSYLRGLKSADILEDSPGRFQLEHFRGSQLESKVCRSRSQA